MSSMTTNKWLVLVALMLIGPIIGTVQSAKAATDDGLAVAIVSVPAQLNWNKKVIYRYTITNSTDQTQNIDAFYDYYYGTNIPNSVAIPPRNFTVQPHTKVWLRFWTVLPHNTQGVLSERRCFTVTIGISNKDGQTDHGAFTCGWIGQE